MERTKKLLPYLTDTLILRLETIYLVCGKTKQGYEHLAVVFSDLSDRNERTHVSEDNKRKICKIIRK